MGNALSRLELRSCGRTDIGRRRKVNQDAFLCDDELGLWVVADGMGGHAAGEVASRESVDAIHGMVKKSKRSLGTVFTDETSAAASRLLEGAVQAATYIVYAMAEIDTGMAGMGTTISAMMSFCDRLIVAQVGDSRIYRLRDGEAVQLTEDHTLVAWQLKQGLISPDEARSARHKNVITRAVGNRDYVQVDTTVYDVEFGDAYLLCSDGLHGYLTPAEIPAVAEPGGITAVRRFINLANERGGKDNITAILVEAL